MCAYVCIQDYVTFSLFRVIAILGKDEGGA